MGLNLRILTYALLVLVVLTLLLSLCGLGGQHKDSIGPGWPRGTNWCGLVKPRFGGAHFLGGITFFRRGGGTISPYGIRS